MSTNIFIMVTLVTANILFVLNMGRHLVLLHAAHNHLLKVCELLDSRITKIESIDILRGR